MRIIEEEKTWSVSPYQQNNAYSFCFTGAETEIDKIKDDGKIERETNLDRRGPRQIGTVWRIPDPPIFSLPTTFKQKFLLTFVISLISRFL